MGHTRTIERRAAILEVLVVVLITSIGLALRLLVLGTGLWRDEAYTYFDAVAGSVGGLVHRLMLGETHPPLFFILEFAWGRIAGWGDVTLKVPALVAGVALIPATYLFGRAAGGRWGGTTAAALVALDSRQIYYAADARPYSLAALGIVLVGWLFTAWLRGRRPGVLAWLAPAGILLVYTQYSGTIFVIALGAYSLAFLRGRTRAEALLLVLAICAAFVPWIPRAVEQLSIAAPWRVWIPYGIRPFVALELLGGTVPLLRDGGVAFIVCTGSLIGVAMLATLKRSASASPGVAVAIIGAALGALFEAAFSSRDVRYMVPFSPLVFVFLGWLVAQLALAIDRAIPSDPRRRLIPAIGVVVLTVVALAGAQFARGLSVRAKSGMRDFVAAGLSDPTKTLYLCAPDYAAATLGFYGHGRLRIRGFARWEQPEIFDLNGYAELWKDPQLLGTALANLDRERVRGYQELVLMYAGRAGARPLDAGRVHYGAVRELRDALLRRYRLESIEQFNGIEESFTAYRLSLQGVPSAHVTLRRGPRAGSS